MTEIEHSPMLVQALATAHEGNAVSHLSETRDRHPDRDTKASKWTQNDMLAASSFAVAGSLWSLIDPRRAVKCYRQAARLYRGLGHSYWMVMSLASGSDTEIDSMPAAIDSISGPDVQTAAPAPSSQVVAFGMIGNEVAGMFGRGAPDERRGIRQEWLDHQWRHIGNVPVGRLGVPLDHYGQCARAISASRAVGSIDQFAAEAVRYVRRAAEVIRAASHDSFHWRRLQLAILPAEPEAVAMTVAMSKISHMSFGQPISSMVELDRHGRLLAEVGDSMWEASH